MVPFKVFPPEKTYRAPINFWLGKLLALPNLNSLYRQSKKRTLATTLGIIPPVQCP